ncbi:MAG: DUF4338 domain-containing protein [Clostridiales bacterium]|nr:DUF4338 domain-containing protein [Clostridiales bacterium]
MTVPSEKTPLSPVLEAYRERVRTLLEEYGYEVGDDWQLSLREEPRKILARFAALTNPRPDPRVERYFAKPSEVRPEAIKPVLRPVEGERDSRIFRHALSFWSVPVSAGYGRRMRFILWDDASGKVMGILGLCDPIIGLSTRDQYIGWDKRAREDRLYHMMSAYVLGAVPPYNALRGAKLVALLAGSDAVRAHFRQRYAGKASVIRGVVRPPELILIDTMGAFGKSAIYTRLKGWRFVGYTQGQSHYHLSSNGIYEVLEEALRIAGKEDILKRHRYGDGPNWKWRVVQEACKTLSIPEKVMAHRVRRAYYVYPLAERWREFLRGETDDPLPLRLPEEKLVAYWRERWLPRRPI